MSHLTTHVLDTASGLPAAGIAVALSDPLGEVVATGQTDADGRVRELGPDRLAPGHYRLEFDTAGYYGARPHFFPRVTIEVTIDDAAHYHVPLLLSPFGYSTYRGS